LIGKSLFATLSEMMHKEDKVDMSEVLGKLEKKIELSSRQ
jgi:hypothetical protein